MVLGKKKLGIVEESKPKEWTPEERAAQAERTRAMHARKKTEKASPPETSALTADDIPEVQEMLDKDDSYETIGEWFGCDAETVRQFCQDHKLCPAHKLAEAKEKYEARQAAAEPEPHRLTVAHPEFIGKREDGQLHDADWPDIKQMLRQGRELTSIASDYDVDPDDLDFFIASCQRREAKQPPGEARPPL